MGPKVCTWQRCWEKLGWRFSCLLPVPSACPLCLSLLPVPSSSQGDRGFDGQQGAKGDQGEKGERVSRLACIAPCCVAQDPAAPQSPMLPEEGSGAALNCH